MRNPKQAVDILGPGYRTLRVMSATLGDVFDRIGASPRLRTVLAGIGGTYAVAPSKVSFLAHAGVFLHYAGGAWYPRGGGQPIADALSRVITDNGGQVLLRHRSTRSCSRAGRLQAFAYGARPRTAAGDYPTPTTAPIVVSNADLKRTLTELLPADAVPSKLRTRIREATMAVPLHVEYLILDRDLAAEGSPNTNWWVYPR